VKPWSTVLDEVFMLTYCMKGITYGDLDQHISSVDREELLDRLETQLKREVEAIKRP
jgi:hypothetical protein